MYLIKLTEQEIGFIPKHEYYLAIEDEDSQPEFYVRKKDGLKKLKDSRLSNENKHHQKVRIIGFIRQDGENRTKYVHRVVAKAFIPNPGNKPCVDHVDTNPSNNCLNNLRWVTHSENNNNQLTREHMSESAKKRGK